MAGRAVVERELLNGMRARIDLAYVAGARLGKPDIAIWAEGDSLGAAERRGGQEFLKGDGRQAAILKDFQVGPPAGPWLEPPPETAAYTPLPPVRDEREHHRFSC